MWKTIFLLVLLAGVIAVLINRLRNIFMDSS